MAKHLYVVTVEVELVFASDSDDTTEVEKEFKNDLAHNGHMRDELQTYDSAIIRPMSYLPGQYELADMPWGANAEDKTIQEFVDEGAAPKYVAQLELTKSFGRVTR